MKNTEIMSIKNDKTGLSIILDDVYIGSPYDDADTRDVVIGWRDDVLYIDEWALSEAQLLILRMYLDRKL